MMIENFPAQSFENIFFYPAPFDSATRAGKSRENRELRCCCYVEVILLDICLISTEIEENAYIKIKLNILQG